MKKAITLLLTLTLILAFTVSCAPKEASASAPATTADRQGNPITLPAKIDKIITFGAANAEILAGLGVADKIIATDDYTTDVDGLPDGISRFNMSSPDVEAILDLSPDLMIVTGMVQTQGSGSDMYKPFADAGVCVIYIPSSESIDGIRDDIRYLGQIVGKPDSADALIKEIDTKIAEVKAIGDTITDKKTVFFTLADSSNLYSFGSGTFLNEIIELIGAKNIFADLTSWTTISGEQILDANPDVILTSVYYLGEPVADTAIADIMGIPGFDVITALKNGDVYYIDANASNRPSQNIVKAIDEISKAVYPELYRKGA